jgi:hypothetical protein
MGKRTTMRYSALALFSLAFGFEEAVIVLYIRRLATHGGSASYAPAAMIPPQIYVLEMAREVATLGVSAAVVWLAGSSARERVRGFLFAFGAWDLVYYAALWMLSGYPTLTSYDVLFLVPVPWIAPVWAPVAFAAALVALGYFGIEERRGALLILGLALGFISFVSVPLAHAYPVWLFVPAFACVLSALPSRRLSHQLER